MKLSKIEISSPSAGVAIYACSGREVRVTESDKGFCLTWYVGSERIRRQCGTFEASDIEAKRVVEMLASDLATATEISPGDWTYLKEQLRRIGDTPLHEVVDYYMLSKKKGNTPVAEVAAAYIALLPDGRHKETMLSHVRSLSAADAALPICDFDTTRLQAHLRRDDAWSGKSQANHLVTWKIILNWAMDFGYLSSGQLPYKGIVLKPIARAARSWLTAEQACEILTKAPDEIVAYLAIMMFCGGRRSELEKHMTYEDIRWDAKQVMLKDGKTGKSRIMDIPDNAMEWLLPSKGRTGPIQPLEDPNALLRGKLSFEWQPNILRHSFISHHISLFRNSVLTAELAGTSKQMIDATYKGLVDPQAMSMEYFSISPASCKAHCVSE